MQQPCGCGAAGFLRPVPVSARPLVQASPHGAPTGMRIAPTDNAPCRYAACAGVVRYGVPGAPTGRRCYRLPLMDFSHGRPCVGVMFGSALCAVCPGAVCGGAPNPSIQPGPLKENRYGIRTGNGRRRAAHRHRDDDQQLTARQRACPLLRFKFTPRTPAIICAVPAGVVPPQPRPPRARVREGLRVEPPKPPNPRRLCSSRTPASETPISGAGVLFRGRTHR